MLVVLLALSVKSLILSSLAPTPTKEKNTANWKDHYWEWQAKCRGNNWSGTFFGKDCPDTSCLSSPMVLASNWLIKPIEITKNNKKVLEIFIG
jgi:hypothetical protein